jgi:IS5 family transposase
VDKDFLDVVDHGAKKARRNGASPVSYSPLGRSDDEDFYGYKNHVCLDKAHNLIRTWDATDAAVHDRQKLDDVLDLSNTGKEVWGADSVYCSAQIEARLTAKGLQSRIHRRAARNPSASQRQKSANTTGSKVRARVEHVFGQQQNSIGVKIARSAASRGRASRSG